MKSTESLTVPESSGLQERTIIQMYEMSAMIAQWDNYCISLSVLPEARVHFPAVAEYFKGFFPG